MNFQNITFQDFLNIDLIKNRYQYDYYTFEELTKILKMKKQ